MKPPLTFYLKFFKGSEAAYINFHASFSEPYPSEKKNHFQQKGRPKVLQIEPLNKRNTINFGDHYEYLYLHISLEQPVAAKIAIKGCFPVGYNDAKEVLKREKLSGIEQEQNRKSIKIFIENQEKIIAENFKKGQRIQNDNIARSEHHQAIEIGRRIRLGKQ